MDWRLNQAPLTMTQWHPRQHGTEPHPSADVVLMAKICWASRSGRGGWSSKPRKHVNPSNRGVLELTEDDSAGR